MGNGGSLGREYEGILIFEIYFTSDSVEMILLKTPDRAFEKARICPRHSDFRTHLSF